MRIATNFVTLALILGAIAPSAFACQFGPEPRPAPPKVFWREAPPLSEIEPGETVLEVSFRRFAQAHDPTGEDRVIVESCGPNNRVYAIVRVVAGEDPGTKGLLLSNAYTFDYDRPNAILVGRISPQEARSPDIPLPDADTSLLVFEPRLPPSGP